jgi:hypothetical protein
MHDKITAAESRCISEVLSDVLALAFWWGVSRPIAVVGSFRCARLMDPRVELETGAPRVCVSKHAPIEAKAA